jgi:hypothetical protein
MVGENSAWMEIALTGADAGASLGDVLRLLGRDEAAARVAVALAL